MSERERNSLIIALLVFLIGALSTSHVKADPFYWSNADGAVSGPAPEDVCKRTLDHERGSHWPSQGVMLFSLAADGLTASCRFSSNAGSVNSHPIYLRGTGCEGSTFNPQTGRCEKPGGEKCGEEVIGGATIPKITNAQSECVAFYDADKPSQCAHFAESTRFTSIYVSVDSQGNPIQPPTVTEQGCVANVLDYSHCKAPAPKSIGGVSLGPAPVKCRVALNFTGAVANGDAPQWTAPPAEPGDICEPGADCVPSDEPLINEKEPCVYVPDGEGRMVCSSSEYTGKPGDYTNCGTVNNGPFKCYGKNPSSTGTMTDTKVETKQNADGSTTTTKTDKQTKVVCSGVGSCTTQVTTNVSNTTKDANGNVTSESSKCTGPNCKGTGGIKEGDGKGDGQDEEEEQEGPPGPSRNLQQGEQGSFAEGLSEWDERIAEARAELDQKLDEYGALFKGVFDLNLGAGGGSLPCETFSISTGGVSLRICPADYSEQLSYLRYVLLLAAAALAAVIVLRG